MTSESGRSAAHSVTRDVEPSTLKDLLEHPPRATIAFIERERADILPVRARCRADMYRFGVLPEVAINLENREVVLVIDDGPYFFALRGISVRGLARRIDRVEPGETDALAWYVIEPRRVLAWNYDAIREAWAVPSPSDPEVRAFLRHSMVALVATRSPNERPFMTPLWFVAEGGSLFITTGAESWTSRNVVRNPEMALLFSGERAGRSDRVLRLQGTATFRHGLPPWRVLLRIVAKYYASPRALRVELRNRRKWRIRRRYYQQAKGGPGHLRVVPTTAEFLSQPGGARWTHADDSARLAMYRASGRGQ
jgi:hypothetical protein